MRKFILRAIYRFREEAAAVRGDFETAIYWLQKGQAL